MNWTCRTCEKTIAGYRAEHCPECHETFTGATSGDIHRVGRHGVTDGADRRRCLTVVEMEARGMGQTKLVYWTSGNTPRFASESSGE